MMQDVHNFRLTRAARATVKKSYATKLYHVNLPLSDDDVDVPYTLALTLKSPNSMKNKFTKDVSNSFLNKLTVGLHA